MFVSCLIAVGFGSAENTSPQIHARFAEIIYLEHTEWANLLRCAHWLANHEPTSTKIKSNTVSNQSHLIFVLKNCFSYLFPHCADTIKQASIIGHILYIFPCNNVKKVVYERGGNTTEATSSLASKRNQQAIRSFITAISTAI